MLKKSLFSPAQPRRAETRLFPCGVLNTREAYLVIRAGLARHARKAGLVGSFIFVSRACRARLACLAHNSQTTDEEDGHFEHPTGVSSCCATRVDPRRSRVQQSFSAACLEPLRQGAIFGSNPPRASWPHYPVHRRRSTISSINCSTHPRIATSSSSRPRLNPSGSITILSSSSQGSGRSSASLFQLAPSDRLPLLEQACESCYLSCPAES